METLLPTPEPTSVDPPYAESGSLVKTQVIFVLGQAIAAAGAIIGFLGLAETTWVVKTYRFLTSNEAIPVIGMIVWASSSLVLYVRARRKKIERSVMAALLPNRIATLNGKVHPAIRAAIDTAIQGRVVGGARSTKKP